MIKIRIEQHGDEAAEPVRATQRMADELSSQAIRWISDDRLDMGSRAQEVISGLQVSGFDLVACGVEHAGDVTAACRRLPDRSYARGDVRQQRLGHPSRGQILVSWLSGVPRVALAHGRNARARGQPNRISLIQARL